MNCYHAPYSKSNETTASVQCIRGLSDENTAAPTIQRQVTFPTYTILPHCIHWARPLQLCQPKGRGARRRCDGEVSNSIKASADPNPRSSSQPNNPSVDSTILCVLFCRHAQRISGQNLAEFDRASFSLNAGNPPFKVQTSLGLTTVNG